MFKSSAKPMVIAAAALLAIGCARAVPKVEVAAEPEPVIQGPLADYFCMNGIKPFHDKVGNREVWEDLDRRLTMAKGLGVHGMRIDMWWGVIEPSEENFEWEFPDRVMQQIADSGLEPYPIFCYNAQWSKHSPQTAEEREQFGNYVHELVARYQDKTKQWEVWNEPNITPFWVPEPNPVLYSELLKVSYKEAKRADPEAVLSAICTAGPDYKFIEGVYRNGGSDVLDVVSYHHYDSRSREVYLENELRTVRNIMRRYGDGHKPLYITELGYSTGASTVVGEVSQQEQASWIVKKHLVSLASDVDRFYYFKMIDDDPADAPDGYWGLYDWNYKPKVSHDAYKLMVSKIKPAEFAGRAFKTETPGQAGQAEVQLYRMGEELFAVAWVRDDGNPMTISLPADAPAQIKDMIGNSIEQVLPSNGIVSFQIDKHPRYISGLSNRALALANVTFDPPALFLSPGETTTIKVSVNNVMDEAITIDLASLVNTPQDSGVLFSGERTFSVDANGSISVPIEVSMKPNTAPFTAMEVRGGDGRTFGYEYRLFYEAALRAKVSATEIKNRQASITAQFQNLTSRPAILQPSWSVDGESMPVRRSVLEIAPGEFGEAHISADIKQGETKVTAMATSSSGAGVEKTFHLWGQPYREEAITIDGKLDDWEGIAGIHLSPEENQAKPALRTKRYKSIEFSGDVYAAWTNSHLYIAADIVDATPLVNTHEGTELWRGDSMELYIGFAGPTSRTIYGPTDFQIGLMPGNNGQNGYVWNWKPGAGASESEKEKGRQVRDALIAVTRTDKGYIMEAAIPVAEFDQRMGPNRPLAFDVHLNNKLRPDTDSNDAVLIWNGGDQNWRDPSNWGAALVLPGPAGG